MSQEDSMGKLLAYPVYFFHWAVGLTALAAASTTTILSIANSDHPSVFRNVLRFALGDPLAAEIYHQRYIITFIALSFLVFSAIRKLRIERNKWVPILSTIVDIRAKSKNLVQSIRSNRNRSSATFKLYLISEITHLLNMTSNVMTVYTGHRCHVTVKLVNTDGEISTIARNNNEYSDRKQIDELLRAFQYTENTAFSSIIDRKHLCYKNNRLLLSRLVGLYRNSHRGWWKNYHAALVVPITIADKQADISLSNTFGFVCADNRFGNFDNRACRLLLSYTASRCIDVLLSLTIDDQTRALPAH